jgi:histidinol dehydrogenase
VEAAVARLVAERPGGAPGGRNAAAGAERGASGAGLGARRFWAFYPAAGEDFLALAAVLVNSYAPEHLEIQLADPRAFVAQVRSAGAIFLGHGTPTAFGDYIAGSNHVLPTGGSARFSSPLSVDTFMRKSSYVEMPADAARLLTPRLARVADSEGFFFHRLSAELRTEGD